MVQISYMWINEIGPKIYFSDKIEKDMEVGKKKVYNIFSSAQDGSFAVPG